MKFLRAGAMAAVALSAGGCGDRCEGLTAGDALQMARDAKVGMLSRSTDRYAANFPSDAPVFVRVGAAANGHAATVGFRGRNGTVLIALIDTDCYVGWTEHRPSAFDPLGVR
jgi:hypothetical protein